MTELKRSIGPVQMMLYGIGSMMGAGIYGLVGKAAGIMGSAIWMAFLLAMTAALLTALSYASIASRYPKAGGAANGRTADSWPVPLVLLLRELGVLRVRPEGLSFVVPS